MILGFPMLKKLRLVLGDQLNIQHSWFSDCTDDVLYVLAELKQECNYVVHHGQKIAAFFLAMSEFSAALKSQGHQVIHLTLDDTGCYESLDSLVLYLMDSYSLDIFEYQEPDEYRLREQLKNINVQSKSFDGEHFLLPYSDITSQFVPGKPVRLEGFYRRMRKRFNVLMHNGEPEGGQWNYDADNRNKLKAGDYSNIPEPLTFNNCIGSIKSRLKAHSINYIGDLEQSLSWPINRSQSLQLLDYFCQYGLPLFGRFQDSMSEKAPHNWSLFHSRLAFSLNTKMLNPLEVIESAACSYRQSEGVITIAQIEGFIRQILGWREFVRAVYWANMPDYAKKNALTASRPLPDFFWTGKTKMACMSNAIGQSLKHAYAHHIQRLMITGNFCLIAGINPKHVDAWYLGIYIDAIEWVEMPNTRGMSQFADGGIVASKPYAASANYINKMSDYCRNCHYNAKEKFGDNACPFNALYWQFMSKHRQEFERNPRLSMTYRSFDRYSDEQKTDILKYGQWCIENIEKL